MANNPQRQDTPPDCPPPRPEGELVLKKHDILGKEHGKFKTCRKQSINAIKVMYSAVVIVFRLREPIEE